MAPKSGTGLYISPSTGKLNGVFLVAAHRSVWGKTFKFEKEKGGHTCNDPEQILGNRNAQTYQYHFQTPLSSRCSCAKKGIILIFELGRDDVTP
jgi:hypothetical protein